MVEGRPKVNIIIPAPINMGNELERQATESRPEFLHRVAEALESNIRTDIPANPHPNLTPLPQPTEKQSLFAGKEGIVEVKCVALNGHAEVAPLKMEKLRILNYNIWFSHTDDAQRVASFIQVIVDSDADFVGL